MNFQLELGGRGDDLREGQLFPLLEAFCEGNTYGLFPRCLLTICDWTFSMEFFRSLLFFFISNLAHVYSQYFLTIIRFLVSSGIRSGLEFCLSGFLFQRQF